MVTGFRNSIREEILGFVRLRRSPARRGAVISWLAGRWPDRRAVRVEPPSSRPEKVPPEEQAILDQRLKDFRPEETSGINADELKESVMQRLKPQ